MMKWLIFVLAFCAATLAKADDANIWLPNLASYATGSMVGTHNALDVYVQNPGGASTVTANQGSPGPLNAPWPVEPTDGTNHASYTAGNDENINLVQVGSVSFSLGQSTMANSLSCAIASNQSAIPVSESGVWTVQPGNTVNTTPWLMTVSQGGNSAAVTASNALKVDGSAVIQPVSIAATVSTNVFQFGGSNVVTGIGAGGAGIPRVTVSNDSNILASQSGAWTVQPGNTANTTPWLSTISQGGNSASVTASNALKVDGSAVVQPISFSGTTSINLLQVAGAAVSQGHGTAASAIRVELPTDGTGVVGLNAGSAIVGKVGIDQTTPGTTNGVQINAALPAGANTIGGVTISAGATGSLNSASISGVTSVSAPANTLEEKVCALDTNTANLRVAFGATASASNGVQLQPGRCEDFHINEAISICPESGTQSYVIQWDAK